MSAFFGQIAIGPSLSFKLLFKRSVLLGTSHALELDCVGDIFGRELHAVIVSVATGDPQ